MKRLFLKKAVVFSKRIVCVYALFRGAARAPRLSKIQKFVMIRLSVRCTSFYQR